MSGGDLSIPAFLVRKDTPESRAERERLNDELRGGYRRAAKVRPAVSAGLSETNSKETKMAKIGKKEQALKDARAEKTSDAKLAQAAKDSGAFDVIGGALATPKGKAAIKASIKELRKDQLDPNKTAGGDVALPGKGTPPKTSNAKVAADLAALTGVVEKNEKPEPKLRVDQFGGAVQKKAKVSANLKASIAAFEKAKKKVAAKKPAAAPGKPAGKPAAKAKGDTPAAAKKAPAKPVKAKSGEPWPKPGTKQAAMLDMAKRKEGASEKEICKKLGWKKCRVTLGRVVKAAGFKLEHKRIDDETVYFAK